MPPYTDKGRADGEEEGARSPLERPSARRYAPLALQSPSLWQHQDFRKLWVGQTVSELGSVVTRTALPLVALLVAGLYIGLSLSLRDQPLSQGGAIRATVPINDGSQTEERTFVDAQAFERQVNERTLRNLRNFSLGALAALALAQASGAGADPRTSPRAAHSGAAGRAGDEGRSPVGAAGDTVGARRR